MFLLNDRSSRWWDYVVMETFSSHDWIQNFWMSKETFLYLCNQLQPRILYKDTALRKAISVERRVAITLWCMATAAEYRTIGHLFGVARCTVCVIVHETINAIVDVLLSTYIRFPCGEALVNAVKGFKEKWNLPQCVGAIDGSHIPVRPPELNHTDYYNRKGWYSVIIQAVVDSDYLFRNVNVGWPGSVHDSRVFVNSSLYQMVMDKKILQGEARSLSGHAVPFYLVGDSGYPLLTWLMKPYAHHHDLTSHQKHYNYRISRARIVSENAFGRLKARWRRLAKQNDMHIMNIPNVITACCILHNLCEVHGEEFDEQWIEQYNEPQELVSAPVDDHDFEDAEQIRQALMNHLNTHPI